MDYNCNSASNHASRKEKVKTLPQPISDAERSMTEVLAEVSQAQLLLENGRNRDLIASLKMKRVGMV